MIGSFIWSLFAPERGGRAYVVFAGAALATFIFCQFLWHPRALPVGAKDLEFSDEEKAVLRKYHYWLKDPASAITLCSIASLLQLSAMICVPWFVYQSQWLPAMVGIFAFAMGPFFRQRFDPCNYLNMLASKKPTMGFTEELAMVEDIIVKLTKNSPTLSTHSESAPASKRPPHSTRSESAPISERHGAAFNVLLAKHTYSLINEVDKKKVEERTSEILKRVMPRPPSEFNSEVERYGWYALAMRELGIPPAVAQYPTWNVIRNPFMDILPGDHALDDVSHYIRDKFGVDVSVSTEHRIFDRFRRVKE